MSIIPQARDERRGSAVLRLISLAGDASLGWPSRLQREVTDAVDRSLDNVDEPDASLETQELWRRVRLERARMTALSLDPEAAIRSVIRLAQPLDPLAARVLEGVAEISVARNDLPAAAHALATARRLNPSEFSLWSDQAAVELARGRSRDAVTLLRGALRRRPEDISIRTDLAGALLAAGEADEAVQLFDALARGNPGVLERHLDLGHAAVEAGDYTKGREAAEQALRLAPSTLDALHLLGTAILGGGGDRATARRVYRRILRIRPRDPRAHSALQTLGDSETP